MIGAMMSGKKTTVVMTVLSLMLVQVISLRAVWLNGVDTGAVVMQCVDHVAVLGPEEVEGKVCKEANAALAKPLAKLFSRDVPKS